MNPAERDSIKEMFGDFLKDLHIDPEFLGPFIENDVLSEGMVDQIQARSTQSEKILQLLQILPRCGQNAFKCFVRVLTARSVWLAEKLQRKYKEKLERTQYASHVADNQTIEHEHVGHSEGEDEEDNDGKDEEKQMEESTDPDQSPTPVHSVNLSKTNSDASNFSPNASLGSAGAVAIQYQHHLNHLYINLKNKLRKHEKREISFATPEPATFKMIERLHDELFEKLTGLQINMDQCSRALGGNSDKVPLMSHIIKLKTTKTELEKQLKVSEEQRNKYCEQIMKLDLKVRNLASELQINEEKLNRLSRNKLDQEMEYKHQIQILEERIKFAEKKSTESEDATHVWQMNYIKVQKENEQLRREMYVYQPNHLNRTGAKENLNGILQISNQTKVNQTDRREEEHESASPRTSQTNDSKIPAERQQAGNGRLKQARIHRRQRLHQDLSSLSYLSGSRIQNSNANNKLTKDLMVMNKSNDNMSDIKQMKLSLQNAMAEESENLADNSHKPFKLQVYIPTVNMQKNDEAEPRDNNYPTSKAPTTQIQQEGRFKLHIPTVAMQKFDIESVEDQPMKVPTPQLSPKHFKLQMPTINMQSRDEKVQAERTSPSRRSYKRQPLLKTLSTKETENGNDTKPKRKNTAPQ